MKPGVHPHQYRGHPRFYELLQKMAVLHHEKNHDYTDGKDPFLNFRRCENIGIPMWKGVLIRMGDKFSRIENFAKREKLLVTDEPITVTLLDLAVYCLIEIILYQEAQNAECQETNVSPSTPSSQSSQSESSGSNTFPTDLEAQHSLATPSPGSAASPTTSAVAGQARGPQSWR